MYNYWRFGSQEFPVLNGGENDFSSTTFGAPSIPVYSGEADVLGGIRGPYDLVEIEITTVIEDEAEFTALRSLVGHRDMLYRRRMDDNKYEVILARLSHINPTRVSSFTDTLEIGMTFQAFIPIWVEFDDLPWYFDSGEDFDAGRYFDECTYIEIDIPSGPLTFTIDNTASEVDCGGFIVVRPVTGTITGFTLSTYGAEFKYDDVLPSYECIYLDLDKRTVYEGAHSGYEESVFTNGWIDIPHGEETYYAITYDDLDPPCKFYWFWRQQYL